MTYEQILQHYFGYSSFRSIQLDIIRSIGSGHDTLGLMPTGGGKSITFQVPALAMNGVCLVISPLVALMKDQVEHLKARGIKAEAVYSGLTHDEVQRILDNAIFGAVKFLYVSPERLSNELFLSKLFYMNVCFITVDEAHCISQWGYDFRPSYLKICKLRDVKPGVPVLALTATATPEVAVDIKEKLMFGEDANTFSMSFRRPNLSYVVRDTEDKFRELMHIISSVRGSVIVYTRNREKTRKLAMALCEEGVSATFYHAGLDFTIKNERQQKWQAGEIRVMVATNAFGMGIDKPDVRLVIHIDCPDSVEAYFQEAGRAGRDGKRSYAVLLHNKGDHASLLRHVDTAFPPKDYIIKVYDQLAYFFELAVETGAGRTYEFNEQLFCIRFHHFPIALEGALSVLQNAGYINFNQDDENRPRVIFNVTRSELYNVTNLTPNEDNTLNALLRTYGSLFSDLTYIDFKVIQLRAKLSHDELHNALKSLAARRLIRYVPARNIPTITYTRQRTDSRLLNLSKAVYEDQRSRMSKRITKILQYVSENDTCRERMLMEYFGETTKEDCGHCDVCLS